MTTSFIENNPFTRIKSKGNVTDDEAANEALEWHNYFKQSQEIEGRQYVSATKKRAAESIEKLIGKLLEISISVEDVYLKFNSKFNVTALIAVSRDTLFSEEFDDVYILSAETQSEAKTEYFDIRYSFSSKYSDLFEHNIACDGFIYKRKVVDQI